jgi:YD repeat-containing protein
MPLTMKAICLTFLLSLTIFSRSLAQMSQATNSMTAPSVNNNFLGKTSLTNEKVDVDLYTGEATVNIPICKLSGKQLSVPVSLSYISGKGVRLQDYASQVGLGWQLQAGGSVSRVVRGFADENSNGYIGGGWGNIINAAGGNAANLTTAQQTALGTNQQGTPPTGDPEPDLFCITTPTFSFQFTLDGNGKPVYSNNSGVSIVWVGLSSFYATDDQGNQYYFGTDPTSIEQTSTTIYGSTYQFTTTWYLTKIISTNSGETITFTYTNSTNNDYNIHYCQTYAFDDNVPATNLNSTPIVNTIVQPKYVSTIVSSLGQIDFNYQGGRQDDVHVLELTGLTLFALNPATNNNINPISFYTFNYSYFGAPSTDTNVLRLCLNNIVESPGSLSTASPLTLYSFTYNLANTMPSRNSQTFDFWGYYTTFSPSTANPMVTPSVRTPNLSTAQTDVLIAVSDLMGETWDIGYELNTYYSGGNISIGGLRVNQLIKTWNGTSLTTKYSYVDANNNSTGQIYSVLTSSGAVVPVAYNNLTYYVPDALGFVGQNYSESPFLTCDYLGNFVGYSSIKVTNPNQSYTTYQFSNFNTANCQDYDALGGSEITAASNRAYKRGLMLEKTLYSSAANPITDDVYSYSSLNNPVTSNSWGFHWLVMGMTISWCNQYVLGTCISTATSSVSDAGPSSYYSTFVENYRITGDVHKEYDQHTPTNATSTTTTLKYDQVSDPYNTNRLVDSVVKTDSKQVAHTQTTYYAVDIGKTGAAAIPMVTTSETSAINAMLVAGRSGAVVHTIDNRNNTVNQVHSSYSMALNNNIYAANTSTYISDPANPTPTMAKQQFYTYDPVTSNPIATNSINGSSTAQFYGYNLTMPIASIVDASSSNSPSVGGQGSAYQLANGTYSGGYTMPFTVAANGTLTVEIVWPTMPASGTNNTANATYTISGPPGFTPPVNASLCISSNYFCSGYVNTVANTYTVVPGNYVLTITGSQNPENNFTLFEIGWPSSVTSNFTNEFFYEGFEQIGNDPVAAHTGLMSYSGSYTVPFTIPNGRSYLIQWWNYNGSQWLFNQQAYTGSITLTGQIDDVRIFPKDALMTTYTYNPQVGKTSETDPAGRSTLYQYDGFGRLQTIRDQDNNILKQYDYEFQSCATLTYNQAQSVTLFRNNCGTGLYGTQVTYTVPAGKYSACTLAAANQLAFNDTTYFAQNYANANGTCTSTPPCIAPSTVTAVPGGSGTLTVTWNYPPGVGTNAYAVYVKNASTGATVYDSYGCASPFTVTSGLAWNTPYNVTVTSLCSGDPVSAPVTVTLVPQSQSVNLTNLSSTPSGFCCHGCQYTSGVYSSTPTIGPGTLLYTNAALTTPLTGYNWIYPYTGNPSNLTYEISGNTVLSTTSACH